MLLQRIFRFLSGTGLVLLGLLTFLPAGCAHLRWPWPQRYPVILLTLDSVNVRHVGAYGYHRDTTPHLDRLATEGVLFLRAHSTSAWTSPGLLSLLTGVHPSVHGVTGRGKSIPAGLATIPKMLARKGYQAPGLCYLLSLPDYEHVGCGPLPPEIAAVPEEADDAILRRWLADRPPESFLLWYHYGISHLPYNPPETWRQRFYRAGETVTDFVRVVQRLPVVRKSDHNPEGTSGERIAVENLYDADLAYQDHLLGQAIQYLRDRGLLDSVLLVVTADHGEELLEHGFVGHASTSLAGTLYRELTEIPLIMRFPGGRYRGRVDAPVSQVDIMPTVLDFLGIESPSSAQGCSLMPLIRGEETAPRPVFMETTLCGYQCPEGEEPPTMRSVVMGPWKLIAAPGGQQEEFELYNLEQDPAERQNLISAKIRQAEVMKHVLARQALINQSLASDLRKGAPGPRPASAQRPQWAPVVVLPRGDDNLRFSPAGAWLVIEWVGDETASYTIEYQAGSGNRLLSGRFEAQGNQKKFGPISRSTWDALPAYNPYRFRIRQEPDGPWSPWREFSISSQ